MPQKPSPKLTGNDIPALIRAAKGNTVMLQAGGNYSGFSISGIEQDIVIDGNGATCNGEMKFEKCGKITLKNIRFPNGNPYAVMVVECKGFIARNLTIENPQRSGILTANTPNVDISGCSIKGAKEQHGIYCSQSGDFLRISGNSIADCAFSGVQINALENSANINNPKNKDSISENVYIDGNTIINCQRVGHAGAIQLSGVHTGSIQRNIVLNHQGRFIISLWDDGTNKPDLACKDVNIDNNKARFGDGVKVDCYVNIGKNCTYRLGINDFPADRGKVMVQQ